MAAGAVVVVVDKLRKHQDLFQEPYARDIENMHHYRKIKKMLSLSTDKYRVHHLSFNWSPQVAHCSSQSLTAAASN